MDGEMNFRFSPHVETGMTVFTGLKGDRAPEGFTAIYDEYGKVMSISGRLTFSEFVKIAETLSYGEMLNAEWEKGDADGNDGGKGGDDGDAGDNDCGCGDDYGGAGEGGGVTLR